MRARVPPPNPTSCKTSTRPRSPTGHPEDETSTSFHRTDGDFSDSESPITGGAPPPPPPGFQLQGNLQPLPRRMQAEWREVAPRPLTKMVKMVMDGAGGRTRYGKSYGMSSDPQKANRVTDNYFGPGRYSRGQSRYRVRRRGRSMNRRSRRKRYYGRGLYGGQGGFWDDLKQGWSNVSGRVGSGFKAAANATGMGYLADALGHAENAGRALGWGAYDTVSNEIVDGGAGQGIPQFSSGGGEMGTIEISHKEYVADVFGPDSAGVFQNVTYGINPALPETFPWLSQVAANYEEYTIKQLIFTFRSTVTDFVASNGQVGTVILATQYNANDAPFASKQDMMEYAGAVSAKVSQQVQAGVECDPTQLSGPPGKYTRSGPTPPSEDVKTYDLGTLNVATSNTPEGFNNQAVGELWVSYTIELRKPKFFVTRAQQLLTDLFIGDNGATLVTLDAVPYGVGQQNRIGGLLCTEFGAAYPPVMGNLYYVFPATFSGNVEVNIHGICNTTYTSRIQVNQPAAAPQTTGPPGILQIADMWDAGAWASQLGANNNAGNARSLFTGHYKIVSPTTAATAIDNVLTISSLNVTAGNTPGTLTSYQISITCYNTGMNYTRVARPIMANPVTEQVIEFPAGTGTYP
nr:putative capsid protein [Crucivirus sp.]